ncbi:MAG: putative chromosome-partitioning protein ParB [Firmicutes bacterium ADurb.Bin193]|nr:MAG: putative chromosome-partitioning protein ParB [Firmicutes bacterium ADurb.Bin193]
MALGKKGLGRGLDTLIPGYEENPDSSGATELNIIDIEPRRDQPRKHFDKTQLAELADSIATHGVIQPILVVKSGERYQIIAGERRWRAAKLAGLKAIPAIVRDYDELKVFEVSLIENLQRQDLNPIEEATGYKSLMDKFGMTQEKISERVGKSRSSIANSLRLLSLPAEVVKMVADGLLSTGHAKVVLSVSGAEKQLRLSQHIVSKKLSVREAEEYVKSFEKQKRKDIKAHSSSFSSNLSGFDLKTYISVLEDDLSQFIGTRVKIRHSKGKGKIEIQYFSNEDLDRIIDIIKN